VGVVCKCKSQKPFNIWNSVEEHAKEVAKKLRNNEFKASIG
jgi:hypothetical protein